MTEEEDKVYSKHFMLHGVTPKQFEVIGRRAERLTLKKNEPVIAQGQRLEHVYLVVEGSTRASILGRYLTAASTAPMAKAEKEGGNAGAWVGEMTFLDRCWQSDVGKVESDGASSRSGNAMYSVVAKEDGVVVWRWSHQDMKQLMEKSSDMQAALTRAMTSAVVGKVINFTVSRRSGQPSWQTFLDAWRRGPASATQANFAENTGNENDNGPSDVGTPS